MQDDRGEQLFTKAEAAERLKVSAITVHRLIKAGKLGYHRVASRVLISDRHLRDFLALTERPPQKRHGTT